MVKAICQRSYNIIGLVTPVIGPNKFTKLTRFTAPAHKIWGLRGKLWNGRQHWASLTTSYCLWSRGGGTRMARGGISLVHGLTKSTHITYFSGMKIDPKYAFLHAFFLICPSCPFQNLSIWPKTHPFFPMFAHFCTPKRCTRVHCQVLKNNPNYVNFWTSLIPSWHLSGPPRLWSHLNFVFHSNFAAYIVCQLCPALV